MKFINRIRLVGRKHCGARTRKGTPCKRAPSIGEDGIPLNGRCKLHGGSSTGPLTEQGRAKAALNAKAARAVINANTPAGRALRRQRSRKAFATRHGRHEWMTRPL
jgi:hypothetical protein